MYNKVPGFFGERPRKRFCGEGRGVPVGNVASVDVGFITAVEYTVPGDKFATKTNKVQNQIRELFIKNVKNELQNM